MLYHFEELTFQVLNVGLYSHEDGFFSVNARPYATLSYRLSGHADFEIGQKQFAIKPGDLLFIPANIPYRVEYLASQSIVIHLPECNYGEGEGMTAVDPRMPEKAFLRMLQIWQDTRAVHQIKACLYELLARMQTDGEASLPDPELLQCIRYIKDCYRDPTLSVEEICRRNHISHSSLQRRFQRYYGVTAKQYILRLRMHHALDLLTAGHESVKSVAYACGFTDEKYFSRAFKDRYGMPPMQFFRQLRAL